MIVNKNRDRFWDAVKGVGYLCVLMGHMDLTKYIFNFHMPLFFLVSGPDDAAADARFEYVQVLG